jgi:hypothetical protein
MDGPYSIIPLGLSQVKGATKSRVRKVKDQVVPDPVAKNTVRERKLFQPGDPQRDIKNDQRLE